MGAGARQRGWMRDEQGMDHHLSGRGLDAAPGGRGGWGGWTTSSLAGALGVPGLLAHGTRVGSFRWKPLLCSMPLAYRCTPPWWPKSR